MSIKSQTSRPCAWCSTPVFKPPSVLALSQRSFCCKEHRRKWLKSLTGEKAFRWKGGHPCQDCGAPVLNWASKRCRACWLKHNQGTQHFSYKGGAPKKHCPQCGKEFAYRPSKGRTRVHCSRACDGKWRATYLSGKNNPNYFHGKSLEPYPLAFSRQLKRRIRERDGGCVVCGKNEGKLDIHHIDRNKNNCDEKNLVTLCARHHGQVHRGSVVLNGDYVFNQKHERNS